MCQKLHVFVLIEWSGFFPENPAVLRSSVYRGLTSCQKFWKSVRGKYPVYTFGNFDSPQGEKSKLPTVTSCDLLHFSDFFFDFFWLFWLFDFFDFFDLFDCFDFFDIFDFFEFSSLNSWLLWLLHFFDFFDFWTYSVILDLYFKIGHNDANYA